MLMVMGAVAMRAAEAADVEFLRDMLVEAANAPGGNRSRGEVLADPVLARYVEGWPRASDLGVVAVDHREQSMGAAWLRFFTADGPGFGFVRADVPELAIGVAASRRARGVGRALLRAVTDSARRSGFEHISLSVERANPAAGLYRAEGYRVVDRREHADTMLLDLRSC